MAQRVYRINTIFFKCRYRKLRYRSDEGTETEIDNSKKSTTRRGRERARRSVSIPRRQKGLGGYQLYHYEL